MIVGFSKHGRGGGRSPVAYLTGTHSPDGSLRTPPPVVLRGDPEMVRNVIDALDFQHKYTSGVLSFAPGERLTEAMQTRIMDGFESLSFSGLQGEQYLILWVLHRHAGREELNFLIPRVELTTGKSLNIAPPRTTTRELFDTFRSMINAEYGFADPDDPSRARALSLPQHLARLRADDTRKGKALDADIREGITEYVRREVDAGRIHDRAGVVAYLEGQGYSIPRQGEDYITVEIDPALGAARGRVRLRGGLYHKTQFNPRETRPQDIRYGVPDPERAAALAVTLERLSASRARYHQQRYGQPEAPPPLAREGLAPYLTRTLEGEAIAPAQAGETPAPSTRRRQRRQRMQQAATFLEREADDRVGDKPSRRPQALGSRAIRTQRRVDAATRRLDDAVDHLSNGHRAFRSRSAAFTGHVEDWERWWEQYLGLDGLEQER